MTINREKDPFGGGIKSSYIKGRMWAWHDWALGSSQKDPHGGIHCAGPIKQQLTYPESFEGWIGNGGTGGYQIWIVGKNDRHFHVANCGNDGAAVGITTLGTKLGFILNGKGIIRV